MPSTNTTILQTTASTSSSSLNNSISTSTSLNNGGRKLNRTLSETHSDFSTTSSDDSSTTGEPSSSSLLANVDEYQFSFERLYRVQEARNVMRDYMVNEMHSPESLQFLEKISTLRSIINNSTPNSSPEITSTTNQDGDTNTQFLIQLANSIIQQFILPNAEFEINIGKKERENVLSRFKQFQENSSCYQKDLATNNNNNTTNGTTPNSVCEIFEEARIVIMTELKQDVFPRFVRSVRFSNFMATQPTEFWDRIGTTTLGSSPRNSTSSSSSSSSSSTFSPSSLNSTSSILLTNKEITKTPNTTTQQEQPKTKKTTTQASSSSSKLTNASSNKLFQNRPEYFWKQYEANMSNQYITSNDVKFVNSLTMDSNLWQLLKLGDRSKKNNRNNEYFTSFISTDAHKIIKSESALLQGAEREANAQKLFKCTGVINRSVEELLFTLTNPVYMMDYDNQLSVVEQLEYLSAYENSPMMMNTNVGNSGKAKAFKLSGGSNRLNESGLSDGDYGNNEDDDSISDSGISENGNFNSRNGNNSSSSSESGEANEEKFSSSICLETYPFGWPISNRDFLVSQTLLYEAKTQRYILVKKSISHPLYPKRKGTVRGFIVGGWTIQRVTENQTRFCFVNYTDMDMNARVFTQLCKKKGKRLFDGLSATVEKNSQQGFARPLFSCGLLETLEDFLRHYKLPETVLMENGAELMKQQHKQSRGKDLKFKSFEIDGSLVRLTYVSKYDTSLLSPLALNSIATVSTKNNHPLNISGMLLCGEGVFYQVLEGDPKIVFPLYEKIKKDPRHFDVHCVSEEHGVKECERQYSNWAMKTVDLVGNDHYMAQFMRRIIETVSRMDHNEMSGLGEENEAIEIIYQASKQFNHKLVDE